MGEAEKMEQLEKKINFAYAFADGTKESIAIAMITLGVQRITEGDYLVGGFLVTVGWILIVIDRLRGTT